MFPWKWLRPPRHLLLVFLAIVLLPSVLLVVAGWELVQREELVAAQARQAQREQLAGRAVATLQQRLADVEARLAAMPAHAAGPAEAGGATFVVLSRDGVAAARHRGLRFYPATPRASEAPAGAFAEGGRIEHMDRDYARAAAWFRKASDSPDAAVRAAAFLHEARNHRRLQRTEAALDALGRAAAISGVAVDGVPADLLARWSECDLLESTGRTAQLAAKAAALHADLIGGRWQLDRHLFELHLGDAARWSGMEPGAQAAGPALALSSAVQSVWADWRSRETASATAGREHMTVEGENVLVVWREAGTGLAVFAAGSGFVESHWLRDLRAAAAGQQLTLSLRKPGTRASAAAEARQPAEETGLPWTVAVASAPAPGTRFQVWLGAALLLTVIVVTGTVVIARAAARELAVAQLQSDFVAAVSHEFRTPLTSLRQIGEALQEGRVPTDERKREYYDALVRQTGRLNHLVETLLDFGRMEAGTSPYRREPLDVGAWIRAVVDQFNFESARRGYTVELDLAAGALDVLGDSHALTNALWNLLDNAVKYSPDCRTVWVTAERDGGWIAVRVRDRGIGVPADERASIFGKFFRGAEARRHNIRGTGIGLAMVQHIVRAHGGTVAVDSAPGAGSTFTVLLPCHAS